MLGEYVCVLQVRNPVLWWTGFGAQSLNKIISSVDETTRILKKDTLRIPKEVQCAVYVGGVWLTQQVRWFGGRVARSECVEPVVYVDRPMTWSRLWGFSRVVGIL